VAGILVKAEIELIPMMAFLADATRLAVALGHPAHDCFYLALAAARGVPLIVADESLRRKVATSQERGVTILSIVDIARPSAEAQ
jgi:predicted nucleic acid-binding protein